MFMKDSSISIKVQSDSVKTIDAVLVDSHGNRTLLTRTPVDSQKVVQIAIPDSLSLNTATSLLHNSISLVAKDNLGDTLKTYELSRSAATSSINFQAKNP